MSILDRLEYDIIRSAFDKQKYLDIVELLRIQIKDKYDIQEEIDSVFALLSGMVYQIGELTEKINELERDKY